MQHEWKIGDWCQPNGSDDRYLVYLVKANLIGLIDADGDTRYGSGDCYTHLPDCTCWDWQPPKPIEPPEGYRLLTEGVVVGGDLCFIGFGKSGWRDSERIGDDEINKTVNEWITKHAPFSWSMTGERLSIESVKARIS